MKKYQIKHSDGCLLCKSKGIPFSYWSKIGDYKLCSIKGIRFIMILKLLLVIMLSDNECYLEEVRK